jgi:hypothetical protein
MQSRWQQRDHVSVARIMGWFETEDEALVGDEGLDLTGRFLEDLRAAYLDGPGRLPTLAELEATLTIVLGNVGGRWFEELDGHRVVKLALKTKQAATRQTYDVGDIFAIPLTAGDHAFGRYIYDRPKEGGLIEVYSELRDGPVFDPGVLEARRLGHPLWVSAPAVFEGGEFPILRKDPMFRATGIDKLEMLGGPPHDYKITRLDRTFVRRFDPKQWDEWKYRGFVLRNADNVRAVVEDWLGRKAGRGGKPRRQRR